MNNTGHIVANDFNAARLKSLRANLARLVTAHLTTILSLQRHATNI
jgi:16S rRNA C967 or C1407 C5-methylase (RsmB/RsmF family)